MKTHTLAVLNSDFLERHGYPSTPVMNEINRLGREYSVRIHPGEAYTHAAANILSMPSLSQDVEALWKLRDAGIYIQQTILRAFDIIIFGLQIGRLTQDDCERARRDLYKNGQKLLRCFANCSVRDGLSGFYARLLDGAYPEIGASVPLDPF